MSIIGIGIDMIKINRCKKLILLHGFKILNRILSSNELIKYNNKKKENYLAKIFSVKEALSKASGLNIFSKMFFKNCELGNNKKGKPVLLISGKIKKTLEKLNVKKIFLSITDTEKYVQSIIILEK
ncbi:holo-ACP synthase [Buchnera aphidicola]|uniref:holo-ACP synthase n=1 Tax=Buchnera aphidicola TaxID=9 RepID=UPI00094CF9B1|nr:holo-ACP synthase [Buchnera aphidicola]